MKFLVKIKYTFDEIDQPEFKGMLVFNQEQALEELMRLHRRNPMAYGRFCDARETRIQNRVTGEKVSYKEFHSSDLVPIPPVAQIEKWIKKEISHV